MWEYLPGHAPDLEDVWQPVVDSFNTRRDNLARLVFDGKEAADTCGHVTMGGYYCCRYDNE